jgi:hypothetical protein
MHNAPAVSYPVGRSRFQTWLFVLVALLGIVGALIWITQVDAPGWRQGLMLLGSMVTGFGAWRQWRFPLTGQLAWDGVSWMWTDLKSSQPTQLAVVVDVQSAMLLWVRPGGQTLRMWIWVDCYTSPTRWLALRRAVHQRPRQAPDPLADGHQLGAPQP